MVPDLTSIIEQASCLSAYNLPPRTLDRLASLLAHLRPEATAETGCGASTLVFSRFSRAHTVFAFNEFGVFERVRAAVFERYSMPYCSTALTPIRSPTLNTSTSTLRSAAAGR